MKRFEFIFPTGTIVSSEGRTDVRALTQLGYNFKACRPPYRGELYVKPTGVRNQRRILVAECNHQKYNYLILGE